MEIYVSTIWNSMKVQSWHGVSIYHKEPKLLLFSSTILCMWLPCHGLVWWPIHPCEKKKGENKNKSFRVPHSISTYISMDRILVLTTLPASKAGESSLLFWVATSPAKNRVLKLREKGEVDIGVGSTQFLAWVHSLLDSDS